jgi:hypothetical protein
MEERDPTHRDTRNSRNLASGKDLEGELVEGIDPHLQGSLEEA